VLLSGAALLIGVGGSTTRTGFVLALAVLAAAALFAWTAWQGRLPRPFEASLGVLCLALLAGVSALSVGWSPLPDASLIEALRLVAYTALLAVAGLLAQNHRQRTREFALGFAGAALIVTLYALATRCFPGMVDNDDFARLRLPFGYWNAVGCIGAIGLVSALWVGSSRREHPWLEIAAYPVGGLFLFVLMLSQSRSALLAAIAGVGIWLLIVPQRLRSAAWLIAVGAIAGVGIAWAYDQPAARIDHLPLDARESFGIKLLFVLIGMSAVLAAVGMFIQKRRLTRPLAEPQRVLVGKVLIGCAVVGAAGVLLFTLLSSGSSEEAVPNSPGRLTSTSSMRGDYWSESWKIFKSEPVHGSGADSFLVARLPYRSDTQIAGHAHGMVPQVAADLGLAGLIPLLLLMVIWIIAALRVFGVAKRAPWKWQPQPDETTLAAIALTCAAIVFGVHSSLDWIWFVPGLAFFGLFAGGWTLGAQAAETTVEATTTESKRLRGVRATAIAAVGAAIAWGVIVPVRAAEQVADGYSTLDSDPASAIIAAQDAISINPNSAEAFMLLSSAEQSKGDDRAAEQALLVLASRQPKNPEVWRRLAGFRWSTLEDAEGTLAAVDKLLRISPLDVSAKALESAALQQLQTEVSRSESKR
jgi:hypothetical protein